MSFPCSIALLVMSAVGSPQAPHSYAPDAIVLSPGARFVSNPIGVYPVHVENQSGPVSGAFVEVEISPDAENLVSWCRAPLGGASGQTHPILTGFTDANGNVTFEFYGGGCINPDAFQGTPFIAQVRVDGVVLNEPYIVSPDAVDHLGHRATDRSPGRGTRRCDPGPNPGTEDQSAVTLADAVFHTRPIKMGLIERCSKFTFPYNGPVGVADAVFLTPYLRNGSRCNCQ